MGPCRAAQRASPHETALREPAENAKKLVYWLGDRELQDRCAQLEKLINTAVGSRGTTSPTPCGGPVRSSAR